MCITTASIFIFLKNIVVVIFNSIRIQYNMQNISFRSTHHRTDDARTPPAVVAPFTEK